MAAVPDREAVDAYLGDHSWSPEVLDDALAAETADQAERCRWSGDYPAGLAQALKRRVARNLALRGLPLGQQISTTDLGVSAAPVGRRDPEIERLEAPYRPVLFG